MAKLDIQPVLARLDRTRDQRIKELQELVRIPSVSADPAHVADIAQAAQWLVTRLTGIGLHRVRLVPTSGHPVVVGEWLEAGSKAPTIIIYGHYDVQPAEADDGWTREPFCGDVEDGRVWGRGASDNKGQILAHLHAIEAWLSEHGKLPVNVKVVLEGEEEVGSDHFQEIIEQEFGDLGADVVVISDSPMRDERTPALGYSLRGIVYLELRIQGPTTDLHSGVFGGIVRNPMETLVHLLATLKDPKTGKVLVDGFYDDVLEPGEEERERIRQSGETPDSLKKQAGVPALFHEEGWSPQECIGFRPTLDIHGIEGGYTGPGSKTVIPSHGKAKVSCRLVWDQDAEKVADAIERHLNDRAPSGVTVEVEMLHKGRAARTDPDHPLVQAMRRALDAAWGADSILMPEGGSVLAVSRLQRHAGVTPVLAGFGNRDERMHGPDEGFRVESFHRGAEAAARFLAEAA